MPGGSFYRTENDDVRIGVLNRHADNNTSTSILELLLFMSAVLFPAKGKASVTIIQIPTTTSTAIDTSNSKEGSRKHQSSAINSAAGDYDCTIAATATINPSSTRA